MATLNFKGKTIVTNHHLAVPFSELIPDSKKSTSAKPKLDDNLIIHGDNLLALKALLPTYAGRVKCIYIDPPYNTGNEGWIYNDNVNNPMIKEWLGKVVDNEDLTKHDKWLCMMLPRMRLLRELLKDDGVLFVSIDDNEVARIRLLLEEVFDESNFVGEFVVVRAEGGGLAKQYVKGHDYVLAFAKDKTKFKPLRREKDIRGKIIEKDGRQFWLEEDWLRKEFGKYGTCHYEEIEEIKGAETKKEVDAALKDGRYQLIKKKNGMHVVARLRDVEEDGSKFYSVLKHLSAEGVETLEDLGFGKKFAYPKPVSLVKFLIHGATFSSGSDGDIILDSFAGSGTTAHAVLALNKEDGGNRRFILIETETYAHDVTAERVRRVSAGVKSAKDEALKKGLGGTFSYFELGKPIDEAGLLSGKSLPSYEEMARYIFHVATGESFDAKKLDKKRGFIGSSKEFEVYLIYEPNVAKLKELALTLPFVESLGKPKGKKRLVFAPTKYLTPEDTAEHRVEFAQLPFEIYRRLQ